MPVVNMATGENITTAMKKSLGDVGLDMHNLFHKFVDFLDEANQVRLYVFRSLQRHCPWSRTNT
jgi:hypothetical protein